MKRSEINRQIREAEAFFKAHQFALPPFASWTSQAWEKMGAEADEIRRKALGWDVTDMGGGDFEQMGLILFTLRNGDLDDPTGRNYAEKIMISGEGQVTPWHFHWQKTEDIINRGGGDMVIELAWATEDEAGLSDRPVEVLCDGVMRSTEARGQVVLSPGESITLPPYLYHKFYGKPGTGRVLLGEVSRTNDDANDNRFLEPLGRYPGIEEDQEPYRLLCNEYPPAR